MSLEIIQERLQAYQAKTKQEEENAIKEIAQEIALAGLSRTDFFKGAAFQGGTCLRILYNIKRFSEDLNFVMKEPCNHFAWKGYLEGLETEFTSFGLHCELMDRSEVSGTIKKAFIKDDSFGKVLNLGFKRKISDTQKILIKLEIDINPPAGSTYSPHFLDYPYPFSILCQDPQSLFASKCHALLCREYIKGRDWFDFLWYVQRKTPINLSLLKNALEQFGPFKDSNVPISLEWLKMQLKLKIAEIDWSRAKQDVENFVMQSERHHLNAWSTALFEHVVNSIV